MQNDAVTHDTPLSESSDVVETFGLVTIDQAAPFHCSMSVCSEEGSLAEPAAMQNEVLTQDTAASPFGREEALGLVTMDQAVPFHCSTRVWSVLPLSAPPAAIQNDAVTHETPSRCWFSLGEVLGLSTTDQAVPFHCSTSVCSVPEFVEPTAMQNVDETHDTPRSTLTCPLPPTFGEGTIDQVLGTTTWDTTRCGCGADGALPAEMVA
jgi:hypothetical protein